MRLTKRFHGFCHDRIRNNSILYSSNIHSRLLSSYFDGNNSEESHLPVLVVGAGPVGVVLSILLTKLGVRCAVMEKSRVFSRHPQAHFINNRSMELTSETAVAPWKNFIEVVEAKSFPTSPSWWELCQMTHKGAILVRPDEHIAWLQNQKSRMIIFRC